MLKWDWVQIGLKSDHCKLKDEVIIVEGEENFKGVESIKGVSYNE